MLFAGKKDITSVNVAVWAVTSNIYVCDNTMVRSGKYGVIQ